MPYKKWAAVTMAFVAAVGSPVLTAADASANVPIPWTDQTVFALGPTSNYVAEWNGDGLTPVVESGTSLYGVTINYFSSDQAFTNVEIYSGSGTSWTVIGGPTAGLAAGD